MAYQTKIRAGDWDVFSSGSVIALAGKPVEITLEGNSGSSLLVRFVFSSVPEKKPSFEWKAVGPREGEMTLINFDNTLGVASTEPIRIGSLDNRALFVGYRVYRVGEASHHLHFCFYLGGGDLKDGQSTQFR